MSDIVKSILGFVADKARDVTVRHLSDKDLTDEEFRKVIVSEFNIIESSLKGLSRQSLNSSLSFLKEGFLGLSLAVRDTSMGKHTQNPKAAISQFSDEFIAGAGASTSQQTGERTAGTVFNLSRFEVTSQERLTSAHKSFEKSREQATIAFGNDNLSIEDKIMVSKIRIASRILEKFLDDPDAAAHDCLLYLKELHDVPALRQIFSVHVEGGFKSRFNKAKRGEIVESVTAINSLLSDFISKCTSISFRDLKWPIIKLSREWDHYRFFDHHEMTKREAEKQWRQMRTRWPNIVFEDRLINTPERLIHVPQQKSTEVEPQAVTSTGHIIWDNDIYKKLQDNDIYEKLQNSIQGPITVISADVDANNAIYALVRVGGQYSVYHANGYLSDERICMCLYLRLFVFDKDGNLKRDHTDGLPPTNEDTTWVMRLMENKIVFCNSHGHVFILGYDMSGKYQFSLPRFGKPADCCTRSLKCRPYMTISNKNEIIIARRDAEEVHICTDEGKVKQVIKLPTAIGISGVAFDAVKDEILVLEEISSPSFYDSCCPVPLYVYSTTGELRHSYDVYFSTRNYRKMLYPFLLTHRKGGVAIVSVNSMLRT